MNRKQIYRFLGNALQWNTWVSSRAYQAATKEETASFLRLVESMADDDSIEDITRLKELRSSVDLGARWFTRDENVTNAFCYGIWQSIFPFIDWRDAARYPVVEHGFIPGHFYTDEIDKSARTACVSFGPYRREVIREKRNVPVFTVGPYIQYARQFYDAKKKAKVKKGLGKTLVFVPGHSVNTASVSREVAVLESKLDHLAQDYDSVLVCMFWWDINSPILERFESNNYKIVSAGYLNDPSFMSRLKTILTLADAVCSDSLGTHAAYCHALNIPFTLINCDTRFQVGGRFSNDRTHLEAESRLTDAILENNAEEKMAFNYYWGADIKRTLEERKMIANITRTITERTHGVIAKVPTVVDFLLAQYREDNHVAYGLLQEAVGVMDEGGAGHE